MSTIQKINQLSHRIFNTTKTEKTVARSSNPFAASNFQQNILTEDVFQSTNAKDKKEVSFGGNIVSSSKRMYATFVGAINDFGNNITESLKVMGTKLKEGVVNAWNRISEIGNQEISLKPISDILSKDVTSIFGTNNSREISKMSKMNPTLEVKPMLQDALANLQNEITQAA